MRVVMRSSTGVSNRSLRSKAATIMSLASWLSLGSRQGMRAKLAKVRLSCSFWLECMAGSSAETITRPASMPVIEAYMNASAATFSPTCFMVGKRAAARIGRADRDVEGHLFVGRPLGVDVGETGEFFEDLGAGGARIGGGNGNAGLPRAARYGLVAGEQSDHLSTSTCCARRSVR